MAMNGEFEMGKIQIVHIWGEKKNIGNVDLIISMLRQLVIKIGMTPHGDPQVVKYPVKELGNTIFAFVAYQPLYESYIVYDNWVELQPAYANLIVNSCKDYDTDKVVKIIEMYLKPVSIKIEIPINYDGKL